MGTGFNTVMSRSVFELGNSSNWDLLYTANHKAIPTTTKRDQYFPIPEITIPFLIDSNILAVHVASISAKRNWHFAGILNQKIRIGLSIGGSPDAVAESSRKISLNQIQLLTFRELTDTYAVTFKTPFWINNITLTVWEYIGAVSDTTEILIQNLKADITRIETKIDAL